MRLMYHEKKINRGYKKHSLILSVRSHFALLIKNIIKVQ